MAEISVNTVLGEIKELDPWKRFLLYSGAETENAPVLYGFTPAQIEAVSPTWDAEAMVRGLNKITAIAQKRQPFYSVYTKEQCDDPQKKDVGFWYFPAENEEKEQFVLLLAGGAFQSVCTAGEAFPVAVELCKQGYNVFCINYRVGGIEVLPKPLEDIAVIFKYLMDNKDFFGIKSQRYIVGGFSAGAVLCALWGTESVGSVTFGISKPELLFPIYPAISSKYYYGSTAEGFMRTMYGDKALDTDYVNRFEIENQINKNYPPCFLAHCIDDDVIPVYNSILFKKLLDENQVPALLEIGKFGGHGFGTGDKSDVKGWIGRMLQFYNQIIE